jgi:molecular chaperone DnaK
MDKLQNMLGSMAQAAGAGAQPNPGADCGAGCNPEPETDKKNDGPIDAEYEVVDDDKK